MSNMDDKKQDNFSIFYDTPDTKNHTIDAEILGNSLLGLSKALKQADKVINGETSEMKVSVKAQKEGSFAVDFCTWYNAGGSDVLTTIGFAVPSTGVIAASVIGVISQIKSQKITGIIREQDNESKIELEDGRIIQCPKDVAELVISPSFRKEIDAIVYNPVKGQENAKIIIKDQENNIVNEISSTEAVNFKAIAKNTLQSVHIEVKDIDVSFSQVNFDKATNWKCIFPSGEEVSVKMNDKSFIERINVREENFIKGDLFKVTLETTKTEKEQFVSYKYSILTVIRHRADVSRKII